MTSGASAAGVLRAAIVSGRANRSAEDAEPPFRHRRVTGRMPKVDRPFGAEEDDGVGQMVFIEGIGAAAMLLVLAGNLVIEMRIVRYLGNASERALSGKPFEAGREKETESISVKPVSASALLEAVEGRFNLTVREAEVFVLLAKGHGSGFIAQVLCISQSTAKSHAYSIYRKLGIHSREELIALAEEDGALMNADFGFAGGGTVRLPG